MDPFPFQAQKGRGAVSNAAGRFEARQRLRGIALGEDVAPPPAPETRIQPEIAQTAITYNASPDLGFDRTINPYRGCEHGCIYCYARPNHAFVGLSPGLDFETKIFAKTNLNDALTRDLADPDYAPKRVMIGGVTDPYQPAEASYRLTRQTLETLIAAHHPFSLITKSARILADLDLLAAAAKKGLARVAISLTSLSPDLLRRLEPRAGSAKARLGAIGALSNAGVPVTVMTAPIIPALNDHELEALLEAAAQNGASRAGYVLLRLPGEVAGLFEEWLDAHFPARKKRVLNLMRGMRGGNLYEAQWSTRQRGRGAYADLLRQRFDKACVRLGLNVRRDVLEPPAAEFKPPCPVGGQLQFDFAAAAP
ncbi:MAG TPA: radical SAM protein [Hyphomonadaceae bacterium]|nr:radical SAM protein [Hyphomonadaceae bacterium]